MVLFNVFILIYFCLNTRSFSTPRFTVNKTVTGEMDSSTLPVEVFNLKHFELNTLKTVLEKNLKEFYSDVEVNVVDCPDLSVSPFNLAASGFGGGTTGIIDLGGVPYLVPLVDKKRVYNMETVATKCIGSKDYPDGWYISGAGAGPWPSEGVNSEMILSMLIGKDGKLKANKSRTAKLWGGCGANQNDIVVKELGLDEARCALLANLMVSPGVKGKVLEIKCGKRTNKNAHFTLSIRNALIKEFGSEPIGLGGVFLVHNAPSKIHVMSDFSKTPLNSDEDVNNWLRYYNIDPPMLFQSVLVSSDPNLDLRMEHSHGWSLNGKNEAGHYHYDLQPETVQYHGYYALAQKIYRIDRPQVTHNIGRD